MQRPQMNIFVKQLLSTRGLRMTANYSGMLGGPRPLPRRFKNPLMTLRDQYYFK